MNSLINKKTSLILSLFACCLSPLPQMVGAGGMDVSAQISLRPLHQSGKNLVDDTGKAVTLWGVMDTPNWYFNTNGCQDGIYRTSEEHDNLRHNHDGWALDWNGGKYNSQTSVNNCLAYFDKLLPILNDHEAGTYCNLFRLHLDPAWTNDPNRSSSGENDISCFSFDRLKTYFETVYWPIAQKALENGMYVIMRPPGVCPPQIKVGGDYYNYLLTVWGYLASHPTLHQYSGYVSFELANEPIQVLDANGNRSTNAMRDFFQPIVNRIRQNGFDGILWIPGEGYQSQYQNYQSYPIVDSNFGYAVHYYPGWYGTDRTLNTYSPETTRAQFHNQVPVVDTNPIVVTEIDWSPEMRDANGNRVVKNENEMGQKTYYNWGTWGTGTTTNWGNEFKYICDYYKNISMTLESSNEYVDLYRYLQLDKKIQPAFARVTNGDPKEACGLATWAWYKEWFDAGRGPSDRSVAENSMFKLTEFDPKIFENGKCEYNPTTGVLSFYAGAYGFGGWRNAEGFDVSEYKTITAELAELAEPMNSGDPTFRVFLENDYWTKTNFREAKFVVDNVGKTTVSIDISDVDKLYIVGFWNYGNKDGQWSRSPMKIKSVTLTPINDIKTDCFDFSAMNFTLGSPQWDNATWTMNISGVAQMGWTYATPQDWSSWRYLVVVQQEPDIIEGAKPVGLRICDGNYDFYDRSMRFYYWNRKQIGILDLSTIRTNGWENGDKSDKLYPNFNLNHITKVYFDPWWGGRSSFAVSALYLTNTLPKADGDFVINSTIPGQFHTVCLPYNAACCGARVYESTGRGLEQHTGLLKAGQNYLVRSNSSDHIRFYRAGAHSLPSVTPSKNVFIEMLSQVILGKAKPFSGKDADANTHTTISTITKLVTE